VRIADTSLVLDRRQLSDVSLDDDDLMRDLLGTLLEDAARQMAHIERAIREHDSERCRRLAHYIKGACANLGANAAAAVVRRMEVEAGAHAFDQCAASLASLGSELERLRVEADAL
jgi:HPt (histidine-containing phosphotransfer) domain-containing protein